MLPGKQRGVVFTFKKGVLYVHGVPLVFHGTTIWNHHGTTMHIYGLVMTNMILVMIFPKHMNLSYDSRSHES